MQMFFGTMGLWIDGLQNFGFTAFKDFNKIENGNVLCLHRS
jgi:hypothetical protein